MTRMRLCSWLLVGVCICVVGGALSADAEPRHDWRGVEKVPVGYLVEFAHIRERHDAEQMGLALDAIAKAQGLGLTRADIEPYVDIGAMTVAFPTLSPESAASRAVGWAAATALRLRDAFDGVPEETRAPQD